MLFDYDKADRIFFAVLILLALWLFGSGLRPGRMLLPYPDDLFAIPQEGLAVSNEKVSIPGADIVLQYQPWNDYACERLKKGEMPYWNPYNLCGTPFFANCLNQLTYLPRLLFGIILPNETVITALILLHFLLGGVGFYYFLKAYDISPFAAGVASLLFLFKFCEPTIMLMVPIGFVVAYMPISLLILIKLIRGGRWFYTLYLAICLSCLVSSSYPVLVVHLLYFGFFVLVFELLNKKRPGYFKPLNGAIKVFLGFVLSIFISLAQLLPLWLFYSLSARHWLFGHQFTRICY